MVATSSASVLSLSWMCWKLLGAVKDSNVYRGPYGLFAVIITLTVTIWYPIHYSLKLLSSDSPAENFKNMFLVVTCLSCSLKFLLYARNLSKVQKIELLLMQLDARVKHDDEEKYLNESQRSARKIVYLFLFNYSLLACTVLMSCIFREERSLLYPGWYPFDALGSLLNYCIAMCYQFVGASFQVVQNYAADTFPPLTLFLLSKHVRLLGLRVAKIGHGNLNLDENERELLRCIADQKSLYKLRDIIEDVISIPMFIQFCVTAISTCTVLGIVLVFEASFFERLQFFVSWNCLVMEIAPACYYGSEFEIMFEELHRWIFTSNWITQSRTFKKNMILFTERTFKQSTAYAGGILKINLTTLLGVLKTTYTLCTVVLNVRNK